MHRLLLSIFTAVAFATSAFAQLPPGMKPFETTRVADDVYTFRFMFHRNMFIVTDAGVIVTDPISPRAAKILRAEIAKVTEQPVEYVVYSHEHWDHISGGQIFRDEGARFISHAQCIDEFKRNPRSAGDERARRSYAVRDVAQRSAEQGMHGSQSRISGQHQSRDRRSAGRTNGIEGRSLCEPKDPR